MSDRLTVSRAVNSVRYRGPSPLATVDVGAVQLTAPPAAVRAKTVVGIASSRPAAANAHDARLLMVADIKAAMGAASNPVPMAHTYSTGGVPASFSTSSAANDATDGYPHSLMNCKPDWAGLANGAWDQAIRDFAASIPAGRKVFMAFNHEPENDCPSSGGVQSNSSAAYNSWVAANAPVWCAGQARAAAVIADLNMPNFYMAVVHMGFTFKTAGRNPNDWDPYTPMRDNAVRARTVMAPDGYNKLTAAGYDTMDSVFASPFAWAAAKGAQLFGVSENALNNDAAQPDSSVAAWITNELQPWVAAKKLAYYAYFEGPGPASGTNAFLNTTVECAAFGSFITANG